MDIRKKTLVGELKEVGDFEKSCWVDLVSPSNDDLDRVSDKLRVDPPLLKAALDIDEVPRVEVGENKEALFILQIPVRRESDGDLAIEVVPLGIIITENAFITVCLRHTEVMEDFCKGRVRSFSTGKRTRFLLQVMERATVYYTRYINLIEKRIEEIEKRLQKSFKNEEITRLLELEKSLVYFSHATLANNHVLDKTLKGNIVKLFDEDKELLDDIIIENRQAIDTVKISSDVLGNTMDAYASIISNNLNMVMKFLTSVTIMLTIPTMIASFYGMNVGLPLQNNESAFAITVMISFLFSGLLAIIFWRKQWF